jgi:hypothetical protein
MVRTELALYVVAEFFSIGTTVAKGGACVGRTPFAVPFFYFAFPFDFIMRL